MRRTATAAVLLLISLAPALGEVRIMASPGGDAVAYLKLFALLERSGERIAIDAPCFSACTLVLSTIPRGHICVTLRAILGFHAAQLMDDHGQKYPAPDATRAVASTSPAIRAWIERTGA
jgi:hypothetical protein